jgi:uncharacterized protein YraI
MKYKYILAGVAALALSNAPLAQAAELRGYTTSSVDLLAGPNDDFPAVARVSPGADVNIIGCTDGMKWCDVSWGGNRGWVNSSFLNSDYSGRRVSVVEYSKSERLPVVVFEQKPYWDTYYHDRPFYTERRYWTTTTTTIK